MQHSHPRGRNTKQVAVHDLVTSKHLGDIGTECIQLGGLHIRNIPASPAQDRPQPTRRQQIAMLPVGAPLAVRPALFTQTLGVELLGIRPHLPLEPLAVKPRKRTQHPAVLVILFHKEQIVVLRRECVEHKRPVVGHALPDIPQQHAELVIVQVLEDIETDRNIYRPDRLAHLRNIRNKKLGRNPLFCRKLPRHFNRRRVKVHPDGPEPPPGELDRKCADRTPDINNCHTAWVLLWQPRQDMLIDKAVPKLDPMLPAMKAHGVPALIRYLAGEISLEQAIYTGQIDTRHYSKRQYTWFRHQLPEFEWIVPGEAASRFREWSLH